MRYIDADALIAKGWRLERHAPNGTVISEMSIADVPTADVAEVRHGKWKEMAEYEHGGIKKIFFVCPLCERIEYQKEPYCHCGARMDGDDGETV